jgi:hypothetical protein
MAGVPDSSNDEFLDFSTVNVSNSLLPEGSLVKASIAFFAGGLRYISASFSNIV